MSENLNPPPAAKRARLIDPGLFEFLGVLSAGLFLGDLLLYLGVRWRPDGVPAREFVSAHFAEISWVILLAGTFTATFTVVRGWDYVRRSRTLADRLRAGYGVSYATFSLLAAGIAFVATR